MYIRKAKIEELEKIMPIFNEARKTIAMLGINQWQNGYPDESVISSDIKREESYVLEDAAGIFGSFAMILTGEPTYDRIYEGKWLHSGDGKSYLAIHRVAISVSRRGSGASGKLIAFAEEFGRENLKKSIRIDTHEGNVVMRRMLEKNGFSYTGVIYLDSGEKRVAYEKLI